MCFSGTEERAVPLVWLREVRPSESESAVHGTVDILSLWGEGWFPFCVRNTVQYTGYCTGYSNLSVDLIDGSYRWLRSTNAAKAVAKTLGRWGCR